MKSKLRGMGIPDKPIIGSSHFPSGFKSSELSIPEMSDLMEFMSAWGAENGVTFREPTAKKE